MALVCSLKGQIIFNIMMLEWLELIFCSIVHMFDIFVKERILPSCSEFFVQHTLDNISVGYSELFDSFIVDFAHFLRRIKPDERHQTAK